MFTATAASEESSQLDQPGKPPEGGTQRHPDQMAYNFSADF